jgi:hypothetical protein
LSPKIKIKKPTTQCCWNKKCENKNEIFKPPKMVLINSEKVRIEMNTKKEKACLKIGIIDITNVTKEMFV